MDRTGIIETIVGIIVLIVAGAFMVHAYTTSGRTIGGGSYMLSAVFGKIDGIAAGAEVRIAGVKVGSVQSNDLKQDTYEALVSLEIEEGVLVPDDSVAKVVSNGLLGGGHISIEPGASDIMLAPGERIYLTQGSVDLLGIAMQAFSNQATSRDNGGDDNAASAPSGGLELAP